MSEKPTDVQISYLQRTDPFVRKAIARPLSTHLELLDRVAAESLTDTQKAAIEGGIAHNIKRLEEIVELLNSCPGEDDTLVVETIRAMVESDGDKIPLRLARLFSQDPQRAVAVTEMASLIANRLNALAGSGVDFDEYLKPQK